MEPIYPLTALSKDAKEVREHASKDIVRITENGKATYEAYLALVVRQGIDDIEAGRYVESRKEAFAEAARRRSAHV